MTEKHLSVTPNQSFLTATTRTRTPERSCQQRSDSQRTPSRYHHPLSAPSERVVLTQQSADDLCASVKVWFSNRRAKWRREAKLRSSAPSKCFKVHLSPRDRQKRGRAPTGRHICTQASSSCDNLYVCTPPAGEGEAPGDGSSSQQVRMKSEQRQAKPHNVTYQQMISLNLS